MSWRDILKKAKEWEGEISSKYKKLLSSKPKKEISIPELKYPSEESEIPRVLEVMKDKKLNPQEMQNSDLQPSTEMFNIVDADKSDYKDLIHDVNYYAITLKMKYNRPRPYQVSDKIESTKTTTDDTPAFPSGHSMLAHALEKVLSKKYPNKKKELKQMADKISLSRMQMGSHYPSDIEAGKKIGYIIGDAYE